MRTLPAAAAPVLLGIGAAIKLDSFSWGMSLLAMLVGLALQVGVNFSNDYSDGIRGTDEHRVGPKRLTASGALSHRTVLMLALACFAVAGLAGLILVAWSGSWWLLVIGMAAVIAAWFYTGGKRPYGYAGVGLSELMVFVFFGLFATVGTAWVQAHSAPWWLWAAACGIGLVSTALLLVNNIRDIPTDKQSGKITLCVRMGDSWSRILYVLVTIVSAPLGGLASLWWITLILLAYAIPGILGVVRGQTGKELLPALRNTGLYALAYGVIIGTAFALI